MKTKKQALRIVERLIELTFPLMEMTVSDPQFEDWRNSAGKHIDDLFGVESEWAEKWAQLKFVPQISNLTFRIEPHTIEYVRRVNSEHYHSGLGNASKLLAEIKSHIEQTWSDVLPTRSDALTTNNSVTPRDNREVFIVHGRNELARKAMFAFLRSAGLQPLEWSELINGTGEGSPYIGQVLDNAFDRAQAVLVLMTPDDLTRLSPQLCNENDQDYEKKLMGQARANVLFEAGMALGRNPERTIIVQLGTIRPFSDIAGRHTVRLNNGTASRQEVLTRLKTAGCNVNTRGTDWHTEGDFESCVTIVKPKLVSSHQQGPPPTSIYPQNPAAGFSQSPIPSGGIGTAGSSSYLSGLANLPTFKPDNK